MIHLKAKIAQSAATLGFPNHSQKQLNLDDSKTCSELSPIKYLILSCPCISYFSSWAVNTLDISFPTILRSSSTVPGWVKNLLRTLPCQIVLDHMVHSIFHLILYHLSHPLCISITRALSIPHPVLYHISRASWDIFYWLEQPINQPINDQTGPGRTIRKPDSPINTCNLWINHHRYQMEDQVGSGSPI